MPASREPFGTACDGRTVEKLTLTSGRLRAEVITYGAALRALVGVDRDGQPLDVVLGYDTLVGYTRNSGCMGAVIGRYAGRINGAKCRLDGKPLHLEANEGKTLFHSGSAGFQHRVFTVKHVESNSVCLTYTSADGEGGFPGELTLEVTYTLTDWGLSLRYVAAATKPTFCNITNHSYFNLNGGGDVTGHRLWIAAHQFTPVGGDKLPAEMAVPVEGTPFDFTEEKRILCDIGADSVQLHRTGGYDHNFVLDPAQGMRLAARLTGDRGLAMEVWTEKPGLQLYTANFLHTDASAKNGSGYGSRDGVCLETQFFPDSPSHPQWGDIVLRPGRVYDYTTEFRLIQEDLGKT